jgi:hypothetical protein
LGHNLTRATLKPGMPSGVAGSTQCVKFLPVHAGGNGEAHRRSLLIDPFIHLQTPNRRADMLGFVLYFGGFVALIAWFKYVDVYHSHFSDAGVLVLLNNLFRVLFIFYLFWIVQTVGAILLRSLGDLQPDTVGTLDYLALTFFAGTGPWHVVLLAVGYANLLNAGVMVGLTVPVVALSFRELRLVTPGLRTLIRRLHGGSRLLKSLCTLLLLMWCALLLVKGLYPGGGQNYYNHYFPAYQAFLEHGSIWPNEVWQLYFYVKGDGLFFLGMLLTDPLTQQLVVFCFLSAAGLATFLFIRRVAPDTHWPIVGVLLFFAVYIYTPSGGEFGKEHELNTAFIVAILWMVVVALDETIGNRRIWLGAAASAMTAIVIATPNAFIGVVLGAVFGVLVLTYACMGDRRRAGVCFAFAMLAGALVAGIWLLNFVTTGLFSDFALHYFWRFTDFEKLHRTGALPIALTMPRFGANTGVPLAQSLRFLNFTSRLYLLWPLVLGGLLVTLTSTCQRYRAGATGKRLPSSAAVVLGAVFVVFAVLTVTAGRGASGSYFRFASFMVPVMIVAGCTLWTAPISLRSLPSVAAVFGHPLAPVVVLAVCAVVIAHKTRIDRAIVPLGANALSYAVGILSIDDAFARQSDGQPIMGRRGDATIAAGAPARTSPQARVAGIYPGARGAYATVGPHTPIWSLHWDSYCMLPDCKMMNFSFFIMTPSWERLMWGTPEEGRAALRAAGLNYFLYSRELLIIDPLPLSQLFSPDNIARYFGIRWTDGTTTLLTWAGSGTTALGEEWVADYRQSVATSRRVQDFPNAALKTFFEQLSASPHPWRPIEPPKRTR